MVLPPPPYYAVIFSSRRRDEDGDGYERMAERMLTLALQQSGCLGAESARGADGFGLTVSYWSDEDSIRAWKAVAAHEVAQRLGLARWYEAYEVRVARVERAYGSHDTSMATTTTPA